VTIEINGRLFKADAPALLDHYREHPDFRQALACEKCEQICAIGVDCPCCATIGKSFSGSKRNKKMSPHLPIPIGEVLVALKGFAA